MRSTHPLFRLSLISLLVSASSGAFAGAFMLSEQNAVQTGDFGAGGAAIAEDASTAWFNPAGLIRLDKPQVVTGGNEIAFSSKFSGSITQWLDSADGITPPTQYTQYVSNVDGGTSTFVPYFHLAYPINPNLVAGFSLTAPFGAALDYGTDTFARYAGTSTNLKVIDISPSLGFKINKQLSAGFGLDVQRLTASFDAYAGDQPDPTQLGLQAADTLSHNTASDWAEGWHTGLLYQPTSMTRFGLAYHSKVIHHAEGSSTFTGLLADNAGGGTNPNAEYYSGTSSATISLPASTMLSAYHDMNNRWAVMGSIVYTQWNIFNSLTLNNLVDSNYFSGDFSQNLFDASIPQHFHNTWKISAGTNYKIDDQWLVRTGLGYDESPTNNTDRNLRLPDGDHYALALGGRYQATKALALDAGWTHIFIKPARIDNTTVTDHQNVYVSGKAYSYANIFGLQMTYSFA